MGRQLEKALALHRAGDLAAAETLYAGICRRDRDDARALFLLGVVRLGLGRNEDAAKPLRRATQIAPRDGEAWRALAEACDRLGLIDEASAATERAIALLPADAALRLNLSALRLAAGDGEGALAASEAALALQPTSVDAAMNAGLAAKLLGRAEASVAFFERAVSLAPGDVRPLFNLANLLLQEGDPAGAEPRLAQALQLRPDFAAARLARVDALIDLGRHDEALAQIDLVPADGAMAPVARVWRCTKQLPILYRDQAEVAARRAAYTASLEQLAAEVNAAPAAYLPGFAATRPFLLAYQGEDDRALQVRYAALLQAAVAASVATPAPRPRVRERLRIGFVCGYFRHHSVWKIPTRGWLAGLRDDFETVCYHTSPIIDEETAVARKMAARFVQGPKSLADWAAIIAADGCDALLYPEIGMDPMALQLAALRLAPVQCNGLGHPVTSGLATIDYALSSDLMEPACAVAHYQETLVRLPNLAIHYAPPDLPPAAMTRDEMGVAADAFAFWCGQSLFKYQPRHDATFAEIAAAAPRARFVFIAHQFGGAATAIFTDRLARVFAAQGLDWRAHCTVLPRLPTAAFAAAAGCCDAILDSLGWAGFNSTLESLAHDLPLVTFEGPFMRGRHGAAILRRLGLDDMIATTPEDVVRQAVRLALEPAFLRDCRGRIAAARPRLYRDDACIAALRDFLRESVAAADREQRPHPPR